MASRENCAKSSQVFCDLCSKQGITSKLVQFHVNLEETILLCINQDYLFPFGSGNISSFIAQRRSKETSFCQEKWTITEPVCALGKKGGCLRNDKAKKDKQDFLGIKLPTKEQRQKVTSFVDKDKEKRKTNGSFPEINKKFELEDSIQEKRFVSVKRLKKTVFEPYTPKRKSNSFLPVNLEQDYKKLSTDEEQFIVDLLC